VEADEVVAEIPVAGEELGVVVDVLPGHSRRLLPRPPG
jgi:hypothetical protein